MKHSEVQKYILDIDVLSRFFLTIEFMLMIVVNDSKEQRHLKRNRTNEISCQIICSAALKRSDTFIHTAIILIS